MARHPDPTHPEDCFGCRVRTVGFAFGSVNGVLQGPQGREAFHGPTIGQRLEKHLAEAGGKQNVEPAGVRWV